MYRDLPPYTAYWETIALLVAAALLGMEMLGWFARKNHFDVYKRTVVVTGGSQGMGRAVAKLLAQKGASVVIVARNQAKLAEALEYVSSSAQYPELQRFHAISADLTKPEENTRIIAEVTEWNKGSPPDVVWAVAGGAHPYLFIDTAIETLHSQMDTNYWTAAYLAHATLRAWLRSASLREANAASPSMAKPRHLIVTSSVGALAGLAGYGTYAPAKAAMRSLADNLRSEVNLYNGYRSSNPKTGPGADVKIHCVLPGTITSPGLEAENKVKHPVTKLLEEGDARQNEDQVAAAAVRGLERGRYMVSTTLLGNAMRVGMMGNSPRNNWLVDTLFGSIINWVWLILGPDMERKVFKYGQKNEVSLAK